MNIVSRSKNKYLENEKRHQRIFKVAFKLFGSKGYKATTTAEIAKNANINEPTLYKHFASKKELFKQCIGILFDEMYSMFNPIFKANINDEHNCLKELTEESVDYIKNKGDKSKFMFQLLATREEPEFKKLMDEYLENNISSIERVIDSAKKKGIIKSNTDSRFLAAFLTSQYFSMILMNEIPSIKDYRKDAYLNVIMNAITE